MRSIITEIEINAPSSRVWSILTDFDNYPSWNPFIKSFEGKPVVGNRFKVKIQPPGSKAMTFKPICLKMEENREFRWLGHLFFKGVFDGEHIFELNETDDQKTIFVQKENFKGILVPLLWKQLDTNTRRGFELMNEALKKKAEENISI